MRTVTHVDEITLEVYVLGSEEAWINRWEIESHLEVCAECRELHRTIRKFHQEFAGERHDKDHQATELPVTLRRTLPQRP